MFTGIVFTLLKVFDKYRKKVQKVAIKEGLKWKYREDGSVLWILNTSSELSGADCQ